jgi:hypothetical protein
MGEGLLPVSDGEGDEGIAMVRIRERRSRLEFAVPAGALRSGQPIVSPYGGGTVVFEGQPRPNDLLQADLMAGHFGITGEHPDHPLEDWREAVAEEETRDSYWNWVAREIKNTQQDFFELQ